MPLYLKVILLPNVLSSAKYTFKNLNLISLISSNAALNSHHFAMTKSSLIVLPIYSFVYVGYTKFTLNIESVQISQKGVYQKISSNPLEM